MARRQGKRGRVEERRNTKEQSLHAQDQMRVPKGTVRQDGKRGMMGNSLGVRTEARSCFLGCRRPCSCCLGSLPPEPEQAGNPTVAAGGWRKESEGVPFLLFPFHTDQFCSLPNKYLTLNKTASALSCVVAATSCILAQIFRLATRSTTLSSPSPTLCLV